MPKGKVALGDCGSVDIASADDLGKTEQTIRPFSCRLAGLGIFPNDRVVACSQSFDSSVVLYDPNDNWKQLDASTHKNKPMDGMGVVDDSSFVTHGSSNVATWEVKGDKVRCTKSMHVADIIREVQMKGPRCFAVSLDSNDSYNYALVIYDIDGSSNDEAVKRVQAIKKIQSVTKLTDGTLIVGHEDNAISIVAEDTVENPK